MSWTKEQIAAVETVFSMGFEIKSGDYFLSSELFDFEVQKIGSEQIKKYKKLEHGLNYLNTINDEPQEA